MGHITFTSDKNIELKKVKMTLKNAKKYADFIGIWIDNAGGFNTSPLVRWFECKDDEMTFPENDGWHLTTFSTYTGRYIHIMLLRKNSTEQEDYKIGPIEFYGRTRNKKMVEKSFGQRNEIHIPIGKELKKLRNLIDDLYTCKGKDLMYYFWMKTCQRQRKHWTTSLINYDIGNRLVKE